MEPPPSRSEARSAPPAAAGFKRIGSERNDELKRRAVNNETTNKPTSRPMRPAQRGSAFFEPETDTKRIAQRQKQLDFGKNTTGYQRYIAEIPKTARRRGDPQTPDKFKRIPKRAWDKEVSRWRRMLHKWDPAGTPAPAAEEAAGKSEDEEPESLPEELPGDLGSLASSNAAHEKKPEH